MWVFNYQRLFNLVNILDSCRDFLTYHQTHQMQCFKLGYNFAYSIWVPKRFQHKRIASSYCVVDICRSAAVIKIRLFLNVTIMVVYMLPNMMAIVSIVAVVTISYPQHNKSFPPFPTSPPSIAIEARYKHHAEQHHSASEEFPQFLSKHLSLTQHQYWQALLRSCRSRSDIELWRCLSFTKLFMNSGRIDIRKCGGRIAWGCTVGVFEGVN